MEQMVAFKSVLKMKLFELLLCSFSYHHGKDPLYQGFVEFLLDYYIERTSFTFKESRFACSLLICKDKLQNCSRQMVQYLIYEILVDLDRSNMKYA